MASILSFFNRLLPFATPGTPLLQDLIHLAVLCAIFYFGPSIQERFASRNQSISQRHPNQTDSIPAEEHDFAQQEPDRPANRDTTHLQDNRPPDQEPEDNPEALQDADDQPQPDPIAGPAHPPQHVNDQRQVGTKKAKALARKDQRRAYNEFLRQQGEAQRARDAEGAEEREKILAAERERRRAAEAAYEARQAKEREARKRREEESRLEEIRRREQVVKMVREELEGSGSCDLWKVAERVGGDVDEDWVEEVLRRSSTLLGRSGDALTMVTERGWVVRVTAADMAAVYRAAVDDKVASEDGVVQYDQLARLIERQICS